MYSAVITLRIQVSEADPNYSSRQYFLSSIKCTLYFAIKKFTNTIFCVRSKYILKE